MGTCFTIDVEGWQYIVTARHVVETLQEGPVEIYHEQQWKSLYVEVAWCSDPPADIAVLAPSVQLTAKDPTLQVTPDGLILGQQVYLLGFVDFTGIPELKELMPNPVSDYPMPIVRHGIFAGASTSTLLIDGHVIPGSSGGPIVFQPQGDRSFRIAGVIAANHTTPNPVIQQGLPTGAYIRDKTGLVLGYKLNDGIEYITNHPSGAPIQV